jgi:hypothetical protein
MNEQLQYLNELLEETIVNFQLMLERGQIDEDEYNSFKAQTFLEYQERVAELLDVEEEDLALSYSDDSELATFNVGSPYADTLLRIGAEAYYDENSDDYDIEGLCIELADITGNEPEDILSLLQGEIAPSDEFTLLLSDHIGLPEEYVDELLVSGIEARGEDINDYLEDEEEPDEDEESSYASDLESRVEFAEREVADIKAGRIISNELHGIEKRVWELVDQGKCTPHVANFFLGEFETVDDQIAAFSQTCHRNQVDPSSQLHGMNMVVRVLEQLPSVAEFGYSVEDELSDEEIEESNELENIADQFIKAWRH